MGQGSWPVGRNARNRGPLGLVAVTAAVALVAGACALAPIAPLVDSSGPAATPAPSGAPTGEVKAPGNDGTTNQGPVTDAANEPCAWAAVRSCALPYPTDDFEVADNSSPTGIRIDFPETLVSSHILDQLGPGASIEDAFGGADGYSALSPIIFEVDSPIHPDGMPTDGGDIVQVFDLTTGQRQDIRVELSLEALRHGAPGTIVMAWPVTRWEYGHRIVASMGNAWGLIRPLTASKAIAAGHLDPVLADLSKMGVGDGSGEGLISATRFTVGTNAPVTEDIRRMSDIARDSPHPVRNIEVNPGAFFPNSSTMVRGEVALTDFRDADGLVSPDHPITETWVPFIAVMPDRPATDAGAPVAVYGHGLTVSKETMGTVAGVNSSRGVATIGIDVPNHGERQAGQGGHLMDLANPQSLGRMIGMVSQGIVDQVSLVEAIEEELAGLDVSPWSIDGNHGDGVPDFYTDTILLEGTSMGSVLGASEVALIPEIDAAFLQVAGTGIADTLYHSQLWSVFSGVVPWNASAGDAAALMGVATMLLDPADATHLQDELRESGRPVFLQVGVGDQIVPNASAHRLGAILGLEQMEPTHGATNLPSSGSTALPPDGRGVKEIWPTRSSAENQGFVAHVSFMEPAGLKLLQDWLGDRLAAEGLSTGLIQGPTP